VIDGADKKFENFIKPFNSRLEAYQKLKAELSKKLVDICDTITRF
jgi:hypothetical protein